MRKLLLTATFLSMATAASAQSLTPGSGSLTDAQGKTWTVTASGSIMENGQYTLGGGGTSALTIGADGTVYGQDNGHGPINAGGWFALSSNGQSWSTSSAPSGVANTAPPTAIGDGSNQPTTTEPTPQPPTSIHVTQGACGNGVSIGSFHVANGRIIAPDGTDWIARGINAADNDMGSVNDMTALFPGLNFVRLAIYKYQDPGAYSNFISTLTAKGIVVEIEHHVETNGATGGGGQGDIASGTWLAQENAFYQAVAAAYKSNPYVWFGTTNEPPNGAGLSQWQQATYNAIRGTGNNNPIMLEIMGWPGEWNNMMDASVYAQMTNVIWDTHYYGWVSGYSTDQATVDKTLADIISQVQQTKSADGIMPALIGEWGPSTDGSKLDPNSNQVIEAVVSVGSKGKYGSAAWHWRMQDCCNNLNNGSTLTAPLGQAVALMIGTTVQACTKQQAAQNAQTNLAEITQQITQPNTTAPDTTSPPTVLETNSAAADVNKSADDAIAKANDIVKAAQAQMQNQ